MSKKTESVLSELVKTKIIPLVKIENIKHIDPLCQALITGGFNSIEIAFRSDVALEAIEKAAKRNDILVGAGTVINMDQVKAAINVGAQFIISPCINPDVIQYCIDNDILIVPGISTPTDIGMALEFGLKNLKFFPSEAFGGVKAIKAISPAFEEINFLPAGGINLNNIREYLEFPKIIGCSGSWMATPDLIRQEKFQEIEKICRETLELIAGIH